MHTVTIFNQGETYLQPRKHFPEDLRETIDTATTYKQSFFRSFILLRGSQTLPSRNRT